MPEVVEFNQKLAYPKLWAWAMEVVLKYHPRITPRRALQKTREIYEAVLRGESV